MGKCSERDMILTTHYDLIGYIRKFRYKLLAERPTGTYLLFDLVKDPNEMVNLVDSHPELFEEMLEGLRDIHEKYPAFLGGISRDASE